MEKPTLLEKFSDPAKLIEATKEELVELYSITNIIIEDFEAQAKAVKDELAGRMDTNGEIIGNWSVVKAKRVNFDVTLEQAQELGAVKQAIDTSALKKLYDKGIEIAHTITEYIMIKPVTKSKNAEDQE
jgi:hypothetical protein